MSEDEGTTTAELIQTIEQAGRTPDPELVRRWLQHTKALRPYLLHALATDWEDDELPDEDDPRAYIEVHAGFLLIAARDEAALPLFAQIFRDPERGENLIEWFAGELHHYGPAALTTFIDLLLDEEAFDYGRSSAAQILSAIAYQHPAHKSVIVQALRQLLPSLDANGNPDIGPDDYDEMWTWAVLELSRLQDEGSRPQIEALYQNDRIDTWIIGDIDDYHERMAGGFDRPLADFDIIEVYEELFQQAAFWQSAQESAAAQTEPSFRRPSPSYEPPPPPPFTEPIQPHTAADLPFGRKVGRNEPCPCGSGQKYKKCHGRAAAAA